MRLVEAPIFGWSELGIKSNRKIAPEELRAIRLYPPRFSLFATRFEPLQCNPIRSISYKRDYCNVVVVVGQCWFG